MSCGNDFGYFRANENVVIKTNLGFTFSGRGRRGQMSPSPLPAGAYVDDITVWRTLMRPPATLLRTYNATPLKGPFIATQLNSTLSRVE